MCRLRFLGSLFIVPALVAAFAVGCGGGEKTGGSAGEKKSGGTKAAKDGGGSAAKSEKTPIKPTGLATLKGKVTFEGAVPERASLLPEFEKNQNKDHCLKGPKEEQENPTWIVDKESKGVKNVVIWLRAPEGKFFDVPAEQQKPISPVVVIDQPFCAFEPHVSLAFPSFYDAQAKKQKKTNQELVVKNSAPITHNTKYDPRREDLDTGDNKQLSTGMDAKISLFDKKTSQAGHEDIVTLKCNIHQWMTGYVVALDHPYAAITNAKGEYEIQNVPAGTELIVVGWHEAEDYFLPGRSKKIEPLNDKEVKTLDFTISKK